MRPRTICCICWVFPVLVLLIPLNGCVSKSKADAQRRTAYMNGQRDALARIRQRQQELEEPSPVEDVSPPQEPALRQPIVPTQVITLSGPVRNPVLPWNSNMTLTQAIRLAGYTGRTEPNEIVVLRNGSALRVLPSQLEAGQDMTLIPGDIIRIR
jgi:hypothetical protein